MMLSACSNSSAPSPWAKQSSPWDQRKESIQDTAAPAAEEYKQELAAVDQSINDVELNYQTQQVDSFAPVKAELTESEVVGAGVIVSSESMSQKEEILNLPADYYTVQLMASVDVTRVHKFAEQNQVSTRYIVPTVRNGVIWHVLLLDVYPDRASAKAGLNEIVDSLKTQPWIRSVGSIQKLMQ